MFDLFAKENKFDPLIADNWYSIPYHSMAATKVYIYIYIYIYIIFYQLYLFTPVHSQLFFFNLH